MTITYRSDALAHEILEKIGAEFNHGHLRLWFDTGGSESSEFTKDVHFDNPAFYAPKDQEIVARPMTSFVFDQSGEMYKVDFYNSLNILIATTTDISTAITDTGFRVKTKQFEVGEEFYLHDFRFIFR